MEYVTLGRTGLKVSKLAIGTNALNSKYDPDVTPRVYNWLLDQGVNYIGTGNMYGDCQTYLRRSILHRRDEFYLSGKGGIVPARDILKGIEAGLYWLGTDYFDVWEMDFIRSMREFEEAFAPGGTFEG
ncbi:MAG: aldo/keto reductase, partial [Chloroflexi bacterium]|nr:aldo/keto reductase [Chloroflexota bacterium]